MKPLVSVILPVYNGEKYIKDAIESVLFQDYDNLELIIVDDGSKDYSFMIVQDYIKAQEHKKVVCIKQQNKGVSSARNRGVAAAKGDYIAFIDADDIWEKNKLSAQVDFLERNPQIGYVLSKHSLILSSGLEKRPDWVRREQLESELAAYVPSALLVRNYVFQYVGEFDETIRISQDSDWFMRAQDFGIKRQVLDQNLLTKRVYENCLSSDISGIQRELLQAIKASSARKSRPKISVIIPVYNGEKYLKEALRSVLSQTYKPYEIIVVDDGSTDATAEIVISFASLVKYVKQDNKGAASARNHGVRMAGGDFLAFLDADDIWAENKLEVQIKEAEKSGDDHIYFGMVEQFFSPDTTEDFQRKYRFENEVSSGFHPGTMLIKKSDFLEVGFFNTEYQTGEFIDWYGRATLKVFKPILINQVMMRRRIHEANHGIQKKGENHDYARIIKAMIERKREHNGEKV